MSSRSSASVSKPAASEAKSSSSSGRRLALTSLTVTSKVAGLPASCSAPYSSGKVTSTSALVAGLGADELLLEAGDQTAGAELEQLIAALAALERHAVELAEVVHHDVVAELGGALDGLERGQPVAQALDLGVDRLIGGGRLAARRPRRPCRYRAWRPGARRSRSRTRAARPRSGRSPTLMSGSPTGAIPATSIASTYQAPSDVAQRLVEHVLAAQPADHDRRRDLALAEAGDLQLAAELAGSLLHAALNLCGSDLGLDAHARLGQLGDGGGNSC